MYLTNGLTDLWKVKVYNSKMGMDALQVGVLLCYMTCYLMLCVTWYVTTQTTKMKVYNLKMGMDALQVGVLLFLVCYNKYNMLLMSAYVL